MSRDDAEVYDWKLYPMDEVSSTMDEAARLAGEGAPAGTVVIAQYQTSGRGRNGNIWIAPRGTCLLATVLFRPRLELAQDPTLSRQVGEKVRDAIAETVGLQVRVKEPNDLLFENRKLCGILCQTSIRGDTLEYLSVGIGLNANIPAHDLPLDTATSLLVETGREVDRDALLMSILDHLTTVPGLIAAANAEAGKPPRSGLLGGWRGSRR